MLSNSGNQKMMNNKLKKMMKMITFFYRKILIYNKGTKDLYLMLYKILKIKVKAKIIMKINNLLQINFKQDNNNNYNCFKNKKLIN